VFNRKLIGNGKHSSNEMSISDKNGHFKRKVFSIKLNDKSSGNAA